MKPLVLAALLASAPSAAFAAWCDYANYETDRFEEGRCQIEQDAKGGYRVTPPEGKPITVTRGKDQGAFHRWKLSGENATFYELDRGSFCGTTDDLAQSLCFSTMR